MPRRPGPCRTARGAGATVGARRGRRAAMQRAGLLVVLLLLVQGWIFAAGPGPGSRSGTAPALLHPLSGTAPPGGAAGLPPLPPALRSDAFPPRPADRARAGGTGPVNPQLLVDREPAPMGVTDFGINATGAPYNYSTSSFVGTAQIERLTADGGTGTNSSGPYISFQLNVEMEIADPAAGTDFTYWVQNVASLNTQSGYFGMLNNIWNFTSPNQAIPTGSLSGNGTVATYGSAGFYSYSAPCATAFNFSCTDLAFPATLQDRVVALTDGGFPAVAFDYRLGASGWVRYDLVKFVWARGLPDAGFVVTGFHYNGIGLFDDAEWDYTGAGGYQVDQGSRLNLSLQFWNGHNLQAVPYAFDHGSNTAETITNLTVAAIPFAAPGIPGVTLRSGSGTLGIAYGATIGTLTIRSPSLSGSLTIGGIPFGYTAAALTLTLAAGTYGVEPPAGGVVPWPVAVPAAGAATDTLAAWQSVAVTESGLPSGTPWGAVLGGFRETTPNASLTFLAQPDRYPLELLALSGFVPGVYPSAVVLGNGSPAEVPVAWTPFLFPIGFTAANLPAGTPWSVSADGRTVTAASATLTVALPNGTTNFTIGVGPRFGADPARGNVTVSNGSGPTPEIHFYLRSGYLVGSVRPPTALLEINGSAVPLTNGSFQVSLLPGTYAIRAEAAGYRNATTEATVTAGNTTEVPPIVLVPVPAPATPSSALLPSYLIPALAGIAGVAVAAFLLLWSRGRVRRI